MAINTLRISLSFIVFLIIYVISEIIADKYR